jgi:antitoxin component YwqK of YwqJK toxin-antitoxin module
MNAFNDNLNRHGYWEETLANGNLSYRGEYNDGNRHGYWTAYWHNNIPMWEGQYDNGLLTGLVKDYTYDYTLSSKEFYL